MPLNRWIWSNNWRPAWLCLHLTPALFRFLPDLDVRFWARSGRLFLFLPKLSQALRLSDDSILRVHLLYRYKRWPDSSKWPWLFGMRHWEQLEETWTLHFQLDNGVSWTTFRPWGMLPILMKYLSEPIMEVEWMFHEMGMSLWGTAEFYSLDLDCPPKGPYVKGLVPACGTSGGSSLGGGAWWKKVNSLGSVPAKGIPGSWTQLALFLFASQLVSSWLPLPCTPARIYYHLDVGLKVRGQTTAPSLLL